jgi:hypothetical protein
MPLNHEVAYMPRERERERERDRKRESNFLQLNTGVSLRWTLKNNKQNPV